MNPTRTTLVVLCVLAVSASAFAQGGPPGGGPGGPGGPGGRGGPGRPPPPHRERERERERDRENDLDALDGDPQGRPRPQRMGPDGQRELDAFWEDNKQKIIDFCKENSPNRWRTFERRIGQVNDYRAPRIPLLMQLKHLMELEKADPEMYKVKVAQIRVEDEIYRQVRDLNRARERNGTAEEIQSLRGNLREQAKQAVKLRLDERQLRLGRLAKRLEDEQQRLAKDRENPDALVDAHMEEVIRTPPGPPPVRRPQTTSQPGSGAPN